MKIKIGNACPRCRRKVKTNRDGEKALTHRAKCPVFWDQSYDRRQRIQHSADGPESLRRHFPI